MRRHAGSSVGNFCPHYRRMRCGRRVAAGCHVGVAELVVVGATALVLVVGQQRPGPRTNGEVTRRRFKFCAGVSHSGAARKLKVRHSVQQPKRLRQHEAYRQHGDLPTSAMVHSGHLHLQLSFSARPVPVGEGFLELLNLRRSHHGAVALIGVVGKVVLVVVLGT